MAKLTPEQITKVSAWVAEGATLSQIQERLSTQLEVSMTYMDVRFLVDDLNPIEAGLLPDGSYIQVHPGQMRMVQHGEDGRKTGARAWAANAAVRDAGIAAALAAFDGLHGAQLAATPTAADRRPPAASSTTMATSRRSPRARCRRSSAG